MTNNQRFPDFLCIGAQKAGTTWLYNNLKKHPEIRLPKIKELHYFDAREKILTYSYWQRLFRLYPDDYWQERHIKKWRTTTLKQQIKYLLLRGNIAEVAKYTNDFFHFNQDVIYSSIFASISEKVTGEITPNYSCLNQDSVAHIYKLMPECKIIFILRNPMDRAWSNARMNLTKFSNKAFNDLSYSDFINQLESKEFIDSSNYLKTIETWRAYYREEQFSVFFFDELVQYPQQFITRICQFLNVTVNSNYLKQIDSQPVNSYATEYKNKLSPELKAFLAEQYHPELEKLSQCFGGYTTEWLEIADNILALKETQRFLSLKRKCQLLFNQ